MDKEGLILKRGGKLIKTEWVYDELTDHGEYVSEDITDFATRNLFAYTELDDNITLRDIFLLLNKHLDFFEIVLGNWVSELTEEALLNFGKPYTGHYDADEIEYLELYHSFHEDKWSAKSINSYGNLFPDFHGIGYMLKEDKLFDWKNKDGSYAIMHPKGERIPWGLSFSSIKDLANIPLKLKKDVEIYKTDYTVHPKDREALMNSTKQIDPLRNIGYSLGQILYGIVWELSWHGPPEARDELKNELDEIVKKIDDETTKVIPAKDILIDKPKLEVVPDED